MRQKKIAIISLILLSILVIAISYLYYEQIQDKEKTAIVTFYPTNHPPITFTCEIASTQKEKSEGLMFREELQNDSGMLFIYEQPQNLSFWMKNTLIPLDIIFIDSTFQIINIESADIQINTSDNELIRYQSLRPAKYVIEINQGLSSLYQLKKGTSVIIEYK